MTAVLHSRLPCCRARVRLAGHGTVRRVCRVCKRAFLGEVSESQVSEHVGHEVLKVTWQEVTR